MAEPTRVCARCERVVLESKFVDAVCPVCVASEGRRPNPTPGKWAPSSMGALSLFVNPVFITSVLTIGRAREWLRHADTKDASDEYDPWHSQIRSNALWGIVLAAFQPIVVTVMLTMSTAFGAEAVAPEVEPLAQVDERAEILALARSDDPMSQLVGVCQLDETKPIPSDRELVQSAMRSTDVTTSTTIRACGHLILATLDGVPIAQRFTQLPFDVRLAILDVLDERDEDPRAPELQHIHLSTVGPQ